jgi:hypothetical protein
MGTCVWELTRCLPPQHLGPEHHQHREDQDPCGLSEGGVRSPRDQGEVERRGGGVGQAWAVPEGGSRALRSLTA